jgi:dUTP pyrophosphatase
MTSYIVNFKKLVPEAVIPQYAKEGDAGLDLTATSVNQTDKYIEYGTGLALQIPEGFVGLLFPRSSVTNKDLMLKNAVGVIDSGYRGEIKFRFQITKENPEIYNIGERIGQIIIMPYPKIKFNEVCELAPSERGEGGYGSSGK